MTNEEKNEILLEMFRAQIADLKTKYKALEKDHAELKEKKEKPFDYPGLEGVYKVMENGHKISDTYQANIWYIPPSGSKPQMIKIHNFYNMEDQGVKSPIYAELHGKLILIKPQEVSGMQFYGIGDSESMEFYFHVNQRGENEINHCKYTRKYE